MFRKIAMVLVLAAAVPLAGCQKKTTGGAAGDLPVVTTDVDPIFEEYDIQTVGVLNIANTSNNRDAVDLKKMMEIALLQSGKYKFDKSDRFAKDAARLGVEAGHKRLQHSWEQALTLDDINLKAVCEATGVDAVLAYEVSQWDEQKVDMYQEGTSKTSVRLRIVIFAADGTLLWSKKRQMVKESNYYNPDLYTRSTQSGEAIYDESKVPPAPPIKPVAQELVTEMVDTIPKVSPAEEPAEEPVEGGGW